MYRELKIGEELQPGDQAYTFSTPDCKKVEWVTLCKCAVTGGSVDEGQVPVRRPKDVALVEGIPTMKCNCMGDTHNV